MYVDISINIGNYITYMYTLPIHYLYMYITYTLPIDIYMYITYTLPIQHTQ